MHCIVPTLVSENPHWFNLAGIMKQVADERLNLSNTLHGVTKDAAGSGRDVPKLLLGGRLFGRAAASADDGTLATPPADGVALTQQPAS